MKYTVITGASSGIGYETALLFAARGKNLVIVARREDQLKELQAKVAEINPNLDVIIRVADLSVAKNSYDLYESVKGLDIETWINNAGFGNYDPVGTQNLTKIETMIHLNIEALTILSSLYVRDFANVEGTQIINISSGAGYTLVADAITYCATKFYVSAFTEGLSHELKEQGAKMKAKILAPAATETEFAKTALNLETFNYEGTLPKFHTAKEMAQFLLDLYDNEYVVGLVNGVTYEFTLQDPIFNYARRPVKQ